MKAGLIRKIVSGGQTGVDRAALDIALALGIPCGGWCPRGRGAEDGVIPARYPLQETGSHDYAERTRRNVIDSDGTLILAIGALHGGTLLTAQLAEKSGKPCLVVDLASPPDPGKVDSWIRENQISVLNVAGPRESQHPGIHALAGEFLIEILS
ncbi:MAG: putative molybdenum carrier protein [Thiohalobacterales bacterium]|nr:putative molybdenum carrier protein [Thiohalobacterales bacterium]